MNPRERFHAIKNVQSFDRMPILDWAGYVEVVREHAEKVGRLSRLAWKERIAP